MPGEKVARVKVGLYEAVRDGMVVNLLLEQFRICICVLTRTATWTPLEKANRLPNTLTRIIATALLFSKSRAKPAMIRERLPDEIRHCHLPGMKACRQFTFVAEEGVRAVVIKYILGSLEVREQVEAAHALGLTAVISSSIESSLGLTQLARIARLVNRQRLFQGWTRWI